MGLNKTTQHLEMALFDVKQTM